MILRRLMNLADATPVLAATNQAFVDVAAARGVTADQALNLKASDARAIKHNGPNPFYGRRRKAS